MTDTTITATRTVRNGVDTATMFATLDAIKAQPEIAKFRFRARNQWLGGAHNRSTIGAGRQLRRVAVRAGVQLRDPRRQAGAQLRDVRVGEVTGGHHDVVRRDGPRAGGNQRAATERGQPAHGDPPRTGAAKERAYSSKNATTCAPVMNPFHPSAAAGSPRGAPA